MKIITNFKNWFGKRTLIIKTLLIVAVIGIGWLIVSAIFGANKQKTSYQTSKVEKGMIVSSVSASGAVLSVNVMSANTKATGIVKTVYVKDGDVVKKGDKILDIDLDFQGQQKNAAAWASYLSAQNNVESAKANQYVLQSDMFTKWKTFFDLSTNSTYQNSDGSPNYTNRALAEFHIAEDNWLATEAKYKNSQAVVTQTQVALNSAWLDYAQSSSTITAPTDGTITSLMYSPGMSIGSLDTGTSTSNQKVATIKTEGNPIVSVNLSEIDVSKVKLGQKTTITLDSIPDKTFTGKVIGVDRIGTTTSGVTQYASNIQLDTSSEQILPNMTVTANIIISRKDNVLLVPYGAIRSQNGQSYVQTLNGGKLQNLPVEIGLTSDTQTEIVSGVKEGDMIVTGTTTSQTTQTASPFSSGFGTNRSGGGNTIRIRD